MESEKQWKLKTRITKGVSGSPNPDLNTTLATAGLWVSTDPC